MKVRDTGEFQVLAANCSSDQQEISGKRIISFRPQAIRILESLTFGNKADMIDNFGVSTQGNALMLWPTGILPQTECNVIPLQAILSAISGT